MNEDVVVAEEVIHGEVAEETEERGILIVVVGGVLTDDHRGTLGHHHAVVTPGNETPLEPPLDNSIRMYPVIVVDGEMNVGGHPHQNLGPRLLPGLDQDLVRRLAIVNVLLRGPGLGLEPLDVDLDPLIVVVVHTEAREGEVEEEARPVELVVDQLHHLMLHDPALVRAHVWQYDKDLCLLQGVLPLLQHPAGHVAMQARLLDLPPAHDH